MSDTSAPELDHHLADNLVHFVRYLRAKGLRVVPETTSDLVRAVEVTGLASRHDVYHAFRALTVTKAPDRPAFDEAFDLFFGSGTAIRPPMEDIEFNIHDRTNAHVIMPVLKDERRTGSDEQGRDDMDEQAGASYVERLARKDFGDLTSEEQAEVRRLIAAMMWRPAQAKGRRFGPSRSGSQPDLRRTFRKIVAGGGDLMPLAYEARKDRRRPLVVLADVSGSMDRYTEMFLYFLHAAKARLGRVEAFVFSTRLTRITRQLRHPDPEAALRRMTDTVSDWAGGTRIGDAFRDFNWEWSRRVTRGGAVALVMSDGWDCGEPKLLDEEMSRLARSVHRVVWINPLAGRAGFSPVTRGMRSVLPYVDDFLPVANLGDLRDLVRLLESVPARSRGLGWPAQ